jgi:hypothetical protein
MFKVPVEMGNSLDANPTEEISSVFDDSGTMKLKAPDSSVEVPMVVPLTWMDAFETGAPLGPVTLPATVFSWAQEASPRKTKRHKRKISFNTFFIHKHLVE